MRPTTGLAVVTVVCLLLIAALAIFPPWMERNDDCQEKSRGFAPVWSPPSSVLRDGVVKVDRTRQVVGFAGCVVLWILCCRRIIRVARA